jgi:hypothetical protein
MTCKLLLLSSTLIGQYRPPNDPCWDINNTANWGHWDSDMSECLINPPVFENFFWLGCDNSNIEPD